MKCFLAAASICFNLACFSQEIVEDKNLPAKFEEKQAGYPSWVFTKYLNDSETTEPVAVALYEYNITDTLNKTERINNNSSPKFNSGPNDPIDPMLMMGTEEDLTGLMSLFAIRQKGKSIYVGEMFEGLQTKLTEKKSLGYYSLYDRDLDIRLCDSCLQLHPPQIELKEFTIRLNTLKWKTGNWLYGEIEYTTGEYLVADPDYSSGFRKIRNKGKLVFKGKIRQEEIATTN